jgi:hypothetical protein
VPDAEALAQPVHHLVQRRRLVIHPQVHLIQRHAAGIGHEQERQQACRIVGMDAVAVQRRRTAHPVAGPHLAEQPAPAGAVDASQAHHAGRHAAAQRQRLGLQQHLAGPGGRLAGRGLVHPFACLLPIDPGAGDKQQAPRTLAALRQPAEHMA